jgi:hypothetical protein
MRSTPYSLKGGQYSEAHSIANAKSLLIPSALPAVPYIAPAAQQRGVTGQRDVGPIYGPSRTASRIAAVRTR